MKKEKISIYQMEENFELKHFSVAFALNVENVSIILNQVKVKNGTHTQRQTYRQTDS